MHCPRIAPPALLLALFTLASCDPPKPAIVESAPPLLAPSYESIAHQYNDRIARFPRLYAQGVIELQWSDSHGTHSDQGDLELWFQRPSSTAIRVSALGDVLLWVGSHVNSFWIFSLHNDPKSLTLGRLDQSPSEKNDLAIHPSAFLDLMGWSPLPPRTPMSDSVSLTTPPPAPAVPAAAPADQPAASIPSIPTHAQSFFLPAIDPATGNIIITVPSLGAPASVPDPSVVAETSPAIRAPSHLQRLFLDPASLLPRRIELYSSTTGNLIAFSTLSRYQSISTHGISVLDFPKIAQLVDIYQASDTQPAGFVKVALGSQSDGRSTDGSDAQPFDRVFDLTRLRNAMPVDELIDHSAQSIIHQ